MTTSTQWQLAEDAARRYETVLVPAILGPAARVLVEQADLQPGEAVLDVGCGTGAATRLAAERLAGSGRVAGLDVNAAMLAVARDAAQVAHEGLEWHEASAMALPFEDASFDVVLMAQTLQFLPERVAALREAGRVVKPGGRVVLSAWSDLSHSPYFHALVDAMTEHVGEDVAAGLLAAFGLSDPLELCGLATEAGLAEPSLQTLAFEQALPAPDDFVPAHVGATPMGAGFDAATEAARRAVVDAVSEGLGGFRTDDGMRVPFSTHVVTAARRMPLRLRSAGEHR